MDVSKMLTFFCLFTCFSGWPVGHAMGISLEIHHNLNLTHPKGSI